MFVYIKLIATICWFDCNTYMSFFSCLWMSWRGVEKHFVEHSAPRFSSNQLSLINCYTDFIQLNGHLLIAIAWQQHSAPRLSSNQLSLIVIVTQILFTFDTIVNFVI